MGNTEENSGLNPDAPGSALEWAHKFSENSRQLIARSRALKAEIAAEDAEYEEWGPPPPRRRERAVSPVAQASKIEQIAEMLQSQGAEMLAQFQAVEHRDKSSFKQTTWLTVIISAITLIFGWLLSVFGTPATVFHLFGH